MRLLHLSDPHLGTHQAAVCDALVALARRLAPQALLVSGDLTQRATAAQFHAARALLGRLPAVPRLLVPGNHDIPLWNPWLRLAKPYAGYERVAGPRPPQGVAVLDLPQARVVAVDTTRWWRHRHGTLSSAQIHTVAMLLRQAPAGCWRIVMSHHPLLVADPADDEDRPWRHRQALAAWQAAGAELLLVGHLHTPAFLRVGPGCWLAQAGSSVSWRLKPGQANSVQLLECNLADAAQGRHGQRYDYDARQGAFVAVQRQALEGAPHA